MLMASRDLLGAVSGADDVESRPATVTNRGYPLLLQSGETYRGQPLVDRQHPHDFWMELAVMYEPRAVPYHRCDGLCRALRRAGVGPVAFMHRPSGWTIRARRWASLADATHIKLWGPHGWGVWTALELEGSAFNAGAQ